MKHPTAELTAYLDGALAPAERDALEAHLAGCPGCRAERDRLAAALALLARLPAAPAPSPTFEQRFQARLAAARADGRDRRGLLDRLAWRWFAPTLAGAVAASVVVLGVGAHRRHAAHERDVAAHLELLEDYEVVASVDAVDTAEDAEVVAHLDELGVKP